MGVSQVQGIEAKSLAEDPATFVLDVRTELEFRGGALDRAHLIPIDQLARRMDELPPEKNTPILVYCAHGVRSQFAQSLLEQAGYNKVFNLTGGLARYRP